MSDIEGMDRFGTGPIRASYFMLASTELQSDFDGLTGAGVFNNWNYELCGNSKTFGNLQERLKAA